MRVKDRNGVSVREGGNREGLCERAAGLATDPCGQPRGHDQEGNKAVQRSVKKINYCARGNECLFDEMLYGDSVWSECPRGHGQERSGTNVQQRNTGHDVMTNLR